MQGCPPEPKPFSFYHHRLHFSHVSWKTGSCFSHFAGNFLRPSVWFWYAPSALPSIRHEHARGRRVAQRGVTLNGKLQEVSGISSNSASWAASSTPSQAPRRQPTHARGRCPTRVTRLETVCTLALACLGCAQSLPSLGSQMKILFPQEVFLQSLKHLAGRSRLYSCFLPTCRGPSRDNSSLRLH